MRAASSEVAGVGVEDGLDGGLGRVGGGFQWMSSASGGNGGGRVRMLGAMSGSEIDVSGDFIATGLVCSWWPAVDVARSRLYRSTPTIQVKN